jgi:hypothetical protein
MLPRRLPNAPPRARTHDRHPAPADRKNGVTPRDDRARSIRDSHFDELYRELDSGVRTPGQPDDEIWHITHALLRSASEEGVDIRGAQRSARAAGLRGDWVGIVLRLNTASWAVLRKCHNTLRRSPPDAPIKSVSLPRHEISTFSVNSEKTAGLMVALTNMGVNKLVLPLPGGPMDLLELCALPCLEEIAVVPSAASGQDWCVLVRPGIKVTHNDGNLPMERVIVVPNALTPIGGQPIGFQQHAPVLPPAPRVAAHQARTLEAQREKIRESHLGELIEALGRPPVGFSKTAALKFARLLLDAVSEGGVDLSLVQGSRNSAVEAFLALDDRTWAILSNCHNAMRGESAGSPLASVTLSTQITWLIVDEPRRAENLLLRLGHVGVAKVAVHYHAGLDNLLTVSGIPGVKQIDLLDGTTTDDTSPIRVCAGVVVTQQGAPVPAHRLIVTDRPAGDPAPEPASTVFDMELDLAPGSRVWVTDSKTGETVTADPSPVFAATPMRIVLNPQVEGRQSRLQRIDVRSRDGDGQRPRPLHFHCTGPLGPIRDVHVNAGTQVTLSGDDPAQMVRVHEYTGSEVSRTVMMSVLMAQRQADGKD